MRHQIVEGSGINHHIFSIERESKAIQAPGSRAVQVFTGYMIVRTVTGTFEAHAVVAERDRTAQVHAALKQCNPVRAITIFENCRRSHSGLFMPSLLLKPQRKAAKSSATSTTSKMITSM